MLLDMGMGKLAVTVIKVVALLILIPICGVIIFFIVRGIKKSVSNANEEKKIAADQSQTSGEINE